MGHTWTMRHETKLSFIKRASRRGNFKNKCLTVSNKHQLWLCYQLECEHLIYPQPKICSKVIQVKFDTEPLELQGEFLRQLVTIHHDCVVKHPRWVKIQSSTYRSGVFVLLEHDDMNPTLWKILDIAFIEGCDIIFYLQKYTTSFFDAHYNFFAVSSSGRYVYRSCNNLVHHQLPNICTSLLSSNRSLHITIPSAY